MPLGQQIVGMRRQDLQEVTICGHYREVHHMLRQNPSICRLRKVDRAPQQAVNLSQIGVSGVSEGYA